MGTIRHHAESHLQALAIRALVISAFSFSFMSLFVRLAGAGIPSFQIVFVRSLVSLLLTVTLIRRSGLVAWRGEHKRLLILRGLFGFGALSCFFYSVTHQPLAEATVIQFTSPIFTAILAFFYLGERTTSRLWGAILLGLLGVLLITRPLPHLANASSNLPIDAILIGLLGAGFTACAHVLVRRLAPHENELVIILYFPLVALPVSLATALPLWTWPTPKQWLLLVAVGFAAQGGQIFLTRGMKHLSAASASVILYLQIVFATFWGLLVLGEQPDPWTIVGSLLVLGGTLFAARRPRLPD